MELREAPVKITRAILLALVVATVIKAVALDFMVAEGRSMLPTVKAGQILVVNRAAYGLRLPFAAHYLIRWGIPRVGEVVILHAPDRRMAVKRCTYISGRRITVVGDNLVESLDSRVYGPVDVDDIIGRVAGIP